MGICVISGHEHKTVKVLLDSVFKVYAHIKQSIPCSVDYLELFEVFIVKISILYTLL